MDAPKYLKRHPMYSDSDYHYLRQKGYTNREIQQIWDRDHANGGMPVIHQPIPDITGYFYPPTVEE